MSVSTVGSLHPMAGSLAGETKEHARYSRRVAVDIVAFFDVTALVLGAILPAYIYGYAGGLEIKWMLVVKATILTALIHHACMQLWNMYDESKLHDFPVYPGRLLAALTMSTFAALGLGIPFTVAELHLWVWYAAWISASYTAILGCRIIARAVLAKMTKAGRFDTRVAVFGAGEIARRVQDHLKSQGTSVTFVGVYDDRPRDRLDADGLDIKGRLEDLIRISRGGAIDRIVIALPQTADQRLSMIAGKLQQLPVSIHVVTHIASDMIEQGPAHKVSAIGSVGLLDVKAKPLTDWAPIVKRAEDVIIGGVLFIVALPVMALIALAVTLESRGPVLFRQHRRGLNQDVIEVYKFRTMKVMEDGDKIEQAHTDDPRITRVGKVLRRLSLDELPQLFNVLRGEMALVGPRPHAVVHDEKWSEMLSNYGVRHQVKPGITGLAQVEGCRGEVNSASDIEARVAQDLAYIRNWSLGLVLQILGRTLGAAVWGKNAH